MKFSRIKNGLLATAAAGVLAVGMSGEAQAFPPGAGAYGHLMVDEFAFIPSVPQTGTVIINSADTGAELFGATASDNPASTDGAIDPALSCLGTCGAISENGFEQAGATTTLAYGDAVISAGDGIDPDGGGPAPTLPTTDVEQGGQAQVNQTGSGQGSSGTSTNSEATFTVSGGGTFSVTITMDLTLDLEAITGGDPSFNNTASAGLTFNISLTSDDEDVEFSWSPGIGISNTGSFGSVAGETSPFLVQRTESAFGASDSDSFSDSGTFTLVLADLPAADTGSEYKLNIESNMQLDAATAIPEPGTLGLLGAGLVALGVTRRRMAKKAA